MSEREYVPPFEPLPPAAVDALVRFLDGQSLIRSAHHVGLRSRPWPRAAVRTEDMLWLHAPDRPRARLARRAVSAGVGDELQPVLVAGVSAKAEPGTARRLFGWNFVSRPMLAEARPALRLLWRAPQEAPEARDPLDFELRWRPLSPSAAFAVAARAALERCAGIQRAWLTEEVLLKDGTEVSSHAHLYVDSTDRRWPRGTADELFALRMPGWRSFGVGRADGIPLNGKTATEIFRRGMPAH